MSDAKTLRELLGNNVDDFFIKNGRVVQYWQLSKEKSAILHKLEWFLTLQGVEDFLKKELEYPVTFDDDAFGIDNFVQEDSGIIDASGGIFTAKNLTDDSTEVVLPSFKGDGFVVLLNRLRDDDEVAVTVKILNELLDRPDFVGQLESLKIKKEIESLKETEAYLLDMLADVQARIKKLSSK